MSVFNRVIEAQRQSRMLPRVRRQEPRIRSDLKAHILELSNEQRIFNVARREWDFLCAEWSYAGDRCPCGQEIHEVCHIVNRMNRHRTFVGNVCIRRFFDIDTASIFKSLKAIRANPAARLTEDMIVYAFRRGFIYEREYHFSIRQMGRRIFSEKQLAWMRKINRRITERIEVTSLDLNRPLPNPERALFVGNVYEDR